MVKACQRSLRRLKTDIIDLYLLHWHGQVPFSETMEAFMALQLAGQIRYYGVSNLDLAEMEQVWSVPGGPAIATNQLLYNLSRRNIEWDLLPWLRERHIPVMAYSPLEQARLMEDAALQDFASRCGMTSSQAALAWLWAKDDIIVIPKTGRRERLQENLGVLRHSLTPEELAELEKLFPPPKGSSSLEML